VATEAGKIRVLSAALTLGNKRYQTVSRSGRDPTGKWSQGRANDPDSTGFQISEADLFENSVSYNVASLQSERCAAQLVQFLLLIRSQSAEILFLRLIVDLVGGADIGS
jgi:hypothetical protein